MIECFTGWQHLCHGVKSLTYLTHKKVSFYFENFVESIINILVYLYVSALQYADNLQSAHHLSFHWAWLGIDNGWMDRSQPQTINKLDIKNYCLDECDTC